MRLKTKDQLYQRESEILRQRVVLKANSQSGSQDLLVQEARSSWESQQDAESYGETRSNTADYRVPGMSISTVKLQDTQRQNNVTKLIEMFEKHQHKKQFLKDMSQKQEINTFSEESQQFLVDMDSTEIFKLFCKNSAKLQCLDCNAFSEIGIIYCSCGRNLKHKRSSNNNPEGQLRIAVEGQSTANLNDRSCSSRRRRCFRKQDRKNMAAIRPFFQGGTNKKDTEGLWQSTILAKKKSCFSIASLLKDMTIQLHELNDCRTPNIWVENWMADSTDTGIGHNS